MRPCQTRRVSGDGRPPWSGEEFRKGSELLLDMVSRHPEAGPRLAALEMAARVVFPDLSLELVVRPADAARRRKGHHLAWSWGRKKGSPPPVTATLGSVVAARCAQGKQPIPLALAREEIALAGLDDRTRRDALLDTVPVLVRLQKVYVRTLKEAGLTVLLV